MLLDEATDEDLQEEINGVNVAFEKSIYPQTTDLTLDFESTPQGEGLVMKGVSDCC